MKNFNKLKFLAVLLLMAGFAVYFAACNSNSTTSPTVTDDEFIKGVVGGQYSDGASESPLLATDVSDLDDGGAVADQDNGQMNPIDSLKRWGRKVLTVDVNVQITNYGDSVKSALVTRTIGGVYIIRGYSGGVMDSVNKPYTEVLKRTIDFKRINTTADPRKNWRLYHVSMLSGATTIPQVGTDNISMTNISVYVNGSSTPTYSFNGPDFTQNIFTTMWAGGAGIPEFDRGSTVRIVVSLTSNQPDTDYVAWHWIRNTFGFHRVPFTLTSSLGNSARTYEKTFTIFSGHRIGVFNGYLSANTRQSLWDDDPSKFSSTTVGTPFKVTR